ncbi:MAG TPA: DUF5946 family protein [Gemmatimonadaceae bacterium]|nr:DUF5946 family protein [Gemmatimonadaceae bacterium]
MKTRCVGCGAAFEDLDGPVHRYMTSSPACWARYGELLGRLATRPDLQDVRQMCVDAYAVQHPGTPNPQAIQSVALHLLSMRRYLVEGLPATPLRVVGEKGSFVWLTPPAMRGECTVADMPIEGTVNVLRDAARFWVESTWTAWAPHHRQVAVWAGHGA